MNRSSRRSRAPIHGSLLRAHGFVSGLWFLCRFVLFCLLGDGARRASHLHASSNLGNAPPDVCMTD